MIFQTAFCGFRRPMGDCFDPQSLSPTQQRKEAFANAKTKAIKMNQTVLILDFGGQYKELIARRVRECKVYSVVKPGDTISVDEIKKINPIGIILTGGPNSVYLPDSPRCDKEVFNLGIPVLGICYGCQLIAHNRG